MCMQAAAQMPTRDRRNYVRRRLRFEYEQHRTETRPERITYATLASNTVVRILFDVADSAAELQVPIATRGDAGE